MIRLALAVVLAVQPVTPPPPVDLPALVPTPAQVPAGFVPLPADPGRIGNLDTKAAAGVLDRSGAMSPELLAEAGFRQGLSTAWTKQDTQEVLLDVLLEFFTDDQGDDFVRRLVEGRKGVKAFAVPGLPDAVGFERGPDTPTFKTPGQREVLLRRGRVVSILVVAGHVTFPSVEVIAAMAHAQRAALDAAPLESAPGPDDDSPPAGLLLAAQALFVLVAWQAVMALQRTPPAFTPRATPAAPAADAVIAAPPSEAPTATTPRRRRPSAP